VGAGKGGPQDPYERQNVKTKLPGRNMLNWQSLCDEIDNVCDRVEAERGPLLCECVNTPEVCLYDIEVCVAPGIPDVDEVAILPGYQRQGIGRKMVEFVIQSAKMFNLATLVRVLTFVPGMSRLVKVLQSMLLKLALSV
jgi:GNAT superfamily N-acetyltransferase